MSTPPKGHEVRQVQALQALFAGTWTGDVSATLPGTPGLSPNHEAMACVLAYANGDAAPLLAWLEDQARSYMRREQAGYRGYYEVAMAVAVLLAWDRRDDVVYRHVLRWWMTYVALAERCSVVGKVYIPGPRQGNPHSEGPWNAPRDFNLATLVVRRPGRGAVGFGTEPYLACEMLQALRETGEMPVLPAPNDAYLPNLRDPLRIRRWGAHRLAVSVDKFGPIEGGPIWSAVVQGGEVVDCVSWRTVNSEWEWTDVDHANIAGFEAPRPPAIPAAWSDPDWEVLLGESGVVPPLPPLPANWPTASNPAPPPPSPIPPLPPSPRYLTPADVDRMTTPELLDLMATDPRRETWGGPYLTILRRAAKELISAGIKLPTR